MGILTRNTVSPAPARVHERVTSMSARFHLILGLSLLAAAASRDAVCAGDAASDGQGSPPAAHAADQGTAGETGQAVPGAVRNTPDAGHPLRYDYMTAMPDFAEPLRQDIRVLRSKWLDARHPEPVRRVGLARLAEYTNPWSWRLLLEELGHGDAVVRDALAAHFASQGSAGQQALTWMALTGDREDWRSAALDRITRPVDTGVVVILAGALRGRHDPLIFRAAHLTNVLGIVELVPLLIAAQSASDPAPPRSRRGDIAWIAFETQVAYVADMIPVTGSGSGAFRPVKGILHVGTVLRVMDAVMVSYRVPVHESLVALTSYETGESTAAMEYDARLWARWYEEQWLPMLAAREAKAREADADGGSPPVAD